MDAAKLKSSATFALQWREHSLLFRKAPAVFSPGEFDEGSQLLLSCFLENSYSDKTAKICDLGCGWGPVATFLSQERPQAQIFAVDSNPRAVQLAQHHFELNQISNCQSWCGDGLDAVPDAFFDFILFNPPVRAGNKVIQKLFNDCQRCLEPGGQIWIVLRTAQGAKSWQKKLAAQFGACETLEISHGYRVMRCQLASSTTP